MEVSGRCEDVVVPVGWERSEEGVEIVGNDVVHVYVEFWDFKA